MTIVGEARTDLPKYDSSLALLPKTLTVALGEIDKKMKWKATIMVGGWHPGLDRYASLT